MTDKKWIFAGDEFKIGDTVLVAFKEETNSPTGMGDEGGGTQWENAWVAGMDYAVGGTFEIADIRPEGVEFVEYVDEPATLHPHGGYLYPLSVLVPVKTTAAA